MKSTIAKLAVTLIPVALLTVLVLISSDCARKIEFRRSPSISPAVLEYDVPGSSYSEVLNNLFSSSWR